ncbi:MAG: enterochelin esterase-like enzyme [Glaciecola sp.]|jgi:enterochelin esterase-like enzyme
MKIKSERGRAIVAVATLIAVIATPATSSAQQATPFGLDLEGEYRMILQDDMSYAEPAHDDSDWVTTTVPTSDGHEGAWDDYDGIGWFRNSFLLPAEADGLNLVLSAGYLDDADEVYLNGMLVGASGQFPPENDSQWFERRLYPVPNEALRYGQQNVIAVRVSDFSGGGGWYKGPVGIFSKERLREQVYGLFGEPASAALTSGVQNVLDAQAAALADADAATYLATIDPAFFHDGDTFDRRLRDIEAWLQTYDSLILRDTEVEVVLTNDGRLLADSNRSLLGSSGGVETVLKAPTQEFLVFNSSSLQELGNRSRFFRDTLDSALEGFTREFVVYLPPSYVDNPEHRYPIVYMLHGINGGAREWEPREFDKLLDELFTAGELAETIVVMPDGESLWYIDSSVTPWRSMFLEEMMPLVEREYRTLPQREFRGLSGVSMGGHGAFTIGWSNPNLFSSIGSHIGALSLPPLVGSTEDMATSAAQTPLVQVTAHDPLFLSTYKYFFDACADDDFRFGEAVYAMDAQLTAKVTPHTAIVYPEGRHNDDCWLPHIDSSFGMHSANFRGNGLIEPSAKVTGGVQEPAPAPEPTPETEPTPAPLPATGGGLVLLSLAGIGAARALRRR